MSFLNVPEIESGLANLAAAYPEMTELITLPHLTHDGRQSHALRVGRKSSVEVDGGLILGGVHAREWVPPDALLSLAADLLEAFTLGTGLVYGGKSYSAAEIEQILDGTNLFFYPCVNPDGRFHSQNDEAMWRKNRRPHSSGGSCIGVDINRNFSTLWDHLTLFAADSGVSASDNPCDFSVYRGPSPESEPETKNVVWMLDTYSRIRWHMDVHSAVPVILHSWGSDDNQTSHPDQHFQNADYNGVRGRAGDAAYGEYITQSDLDIAVSLAETMNDAIAAVRGDSYGFEQAFGLYPASGTSDDYAYSRHFADSSMKKVYAYTVECGHSFQPSWSEAENVIREVSAGLIAFFLEAPCLTSPLQAVLQTPVAAFNDVPEGETTTRAIVWQVSGCDDVTLEVVSGPSSPFGLLLGNSVTIPAPGTTGGMEARLWLSYAGTSAGDSASGTIRVRCVETGEQWDVALTANTIARPTVGVTLVLDQSGSMDWDAGDGRKRVEVLREAAQTFVDVIQPENGVGIVRFDHDAYPGVAVADAGAEVFGVGRAAATAAVASHMPNPAGATSIGDGIELAGTQLDLVSSSYDSTAMIVLTDGQENTSKYIADVAGSIDDTVFAIGLGEPEVINPTALTNVTNGSGGYVVMTGNLSQDERFILAKYYLQVLAGVTNEQIVLDPQGNIKPGARQEVPFLLNEADAGADVILLTPAPEAVRFRLETPNGDVIDPGTLPTGVKYVGGRTTAYYRFNLPVVTASGKSASSGRWTVHLVCDRNAFSKYLSSLDNDPKALKYAKTHGLRYAIEVHARSSIRFTAQLTQREIEPGSTMSITARLSEYGMPVSGRAKVSAQVMAPRLGTTKTIALQEIDEGLFRAEFKGEEYGLYNARVMAHGQSLRGTPYTRETLVCGAIYRPRPPEDPQAPDEDEPLGPGCKKHLALLIRVLKKDRRLATLLNQAITNNHGDPVKVMACLYKAADLGVPVRP